MSWFHTIFGGNEGPPIRPAARKPDLRLPSKPITVTIDCPAIIRNGNDLCVDGSDLHLYEGEFDRITVIGGGRLFIHDGVRVKVKEVVVVNGKYQDSSWRTVSRESPTPVVIHGKMESAPTPSPAPPPADK